MTTQTVARTQIEITAGGISAILVYDVNLAIDDNGLPIGVTFDYNSDVSAKLNEVVDFKKTLKFSSSDKATLKSWGIKP